jgi:hypothetical protein
MNNNSDNIHFKFVTNKGVGNLFCLSYLPTPILGNINQ